MNAAPLTVAQPDPTAGPGLVFVRLSRAWYGRAAIRSDLRGIVDELSLGTGDPLRPDEAQVAVVVRWYALQRGRARRQAGGFFGRLAAFLTSGPGLAVVAQLGRLAGAGGRVDADAVEAAAKRLGYRDATPTRAPGVPGRYGPGRRSRRHRRPPGAGGGDWRGERRRPQAARGVRLDGEDRGRH